LLDASETIGLRRRARLLSHVASAASLFFLQELKLPVFFRAKLAELPSNSHVMDYFFWQRKVGLRNFFSRAFGMILTQQGLSPQDITQKIGGLTEDAQWQMAKELNLPLDKVPQCFLYGAGLWWQKKESEYEVVINNGLSESDTEILAILNQVISGESYIPTASGKEIGWSVSKELPKKSTKNSSPQPDSGGNFRLGSVKGAKIISKS